MTNLRDVIALVAAATLSAPVLGMGACLADETVHLIISVGVLPERAMEGEAVLREEGRLSRQDAGFMSWQLLQRTDKTNHFAIVEVWSSETAFDRHVASDHAKTARSKLHLLVLFFFFGRGGRGGGAI